MTSHALWSLLLAVLLLLAAAAEGRVLRAGPRRQYLRRGRGGTGGSSRTSFGSVGVVGNQIHPDPYVNVASSPFPGVPLFAL